MTPIKTDNLEKEIRSLVAEILEIDENKITPDKRFVEELGMDSMMALEILAGIEKKYRIIIPEDTLPKFTSLNQTVTIIKGILADKKS